MPSRYPAVADLSMSLSPPRTPSNQVDLMPTLIELAHVSPLPAGQLLDGKSLAPLIGRDGAGVDDGAAAHMEGGRQDHVRVALSLFPRCPNHNHPSPNPSDWWEANACEFVDRTRYSFVGLSLRTDRWRYTEWLPWIGEEERVDWDAAPNASIELYDHDGDDGSDLDLYEQTNLARDARYAGELQWLAQLLRERYSSL